MKHLFCKCFNSFLICGSYSSAAAIYKLIFNGGNLRHLFETGHYSRAAVNGARTVDGCCQNSASHSYKINLFRAIFLILNYPELLNEVAVLLKTCKNVQTDWWIVY